MGVEPIASVLEIAPSTYWSAKTRPPSARSASDAVLAPLLVAPDGGCPWPRPFGYRR